MLELYITIKVWNLIFIHGSGLYITIKVWTVYNGKIEVW